MFLKRVTAWHSGLCNRLLATITLRHEGLAEVDSEVLRRASSVVLRTPDGSEFTTTGFHGFFRSNAECVVRDDNLTMFVLTTMDRSSAISAEVDVPVLGFTTQREAEVVTLKEPDSPLVGTPTLVDVYRLSHHHYFRSAALLLLRLFGEVGSPDFILTARGLRASEVAEALDSLKRADGLLAEVTANALKATLPSKPPGDPVVYEHLFDMLCKALGYSDEVRDLCMKEKSINGDNYSSNINLGLHYYQRGKLALAEGALGFARQHMLSAKHLNIHYHRPIAIYKGFDYMRLLECVPRERLKLARVAEVEPHHSGAGRRLVVLFSCDDRYFGKYGNIALTSALSVGGDGVGVHVDVINPSPATVEHLSSLRATHGSRFSYSTVTLDPSLPMKGIYIARRYCIAGDLLTAFKCPLLVVDVDLVFTSDPLELVEDGKGLDVLLCAEPKARLAPWLMPAPFNVLFPTESTRRFLHVLTVYVLDQLSRPEVIDRLYWGVDQAALGQAFDYLAADSAPLKYGVCSMKEYITLANYHEGGKDEFVKAQTAAS